VLAAPSHSISASHPHPRVAAATRRSNPSRTTTSPVRARATTTPAKPAAVRGPGAAPPRIIWPPVVDADYYDVVLWRAGVRVLDLWPRQPAVALRGPKAPSLAPGDYLWFAYPGFGARSAARFGPLAGSGTFRLEPPR
jgi:hypothetical protein